MAARAHTRAEKRTRGSRGQSGANSFSRCALAKGMHNEYGYMFVSMSKARTLIIGWLFAASAKRHVAENAKEEEGFGGGAERAAREEPTSAGPVWPGSVS